MRTDRVRRGGKPLIRYKETHTYSRHTEKKREDPGSPPTSNLFWRAGALKSLKSFYLLL